MGLLILKEGERDTGGMKEDSFHFSDTRTGEKYVLEVHLISGEADLQLYDQYLAKLPENPFVKKELLPQEEDQQIGYFTLHDSHKKLHVLLPFLYRKIFHDNKETGFYDIISPYGLVGPVINKDIDEQIMKKFWEQVDDWYRQNNVVSEFIRFNFDNNYKGFTGSKIPTLKMVCGKILPRKEQWKNFKPKVRNNVRKAWSYDLKCLVYHKNISIATIKGFYRIYEKTMDRHKAESRYRHSFDFFKDFIQNNPGSCALAVVYKENIAISVELLLLTRDVVYSFLGGTDEAYFHTRPNDLLKFEVIKWSRVNGYKYYFLGGGKVENDSLYHYKKAFFPKDKDYTFYTGRKILNQDIYQTLVRNTPNVSKVRSNQFFPLYRFVDRE